MAARLYEADDFVADVYVLTAEEGGRRTAPCQGVRWNFLIEGDSFQVGLESYWPDFLDEEGQSLPKGAIVSQGRTHRARFWTPFAEPREVLSSRLDVGVRFYSCEGGRKVARGTIIRLTGIRT